MNIKQINETLEQFLEKSSNGLNRYISKQNKLMEKLNEEISLTDFKVNKFKNNVKDFADSLINIGQTINPSNPYDWVADKLEEMSKWNKKDWESLFKKELSFKDIRDAQITFETLSRQIRHVADLYEKSKENC